ncbi:unnamed protein product [Oncorhynchus mykiss]|uniref:WH1 domain-containing protein n=1 Tax=Oncorhynchus mykiss TaxID=8022 RepID=A0A060XLA1_ONCMY|nr:unnamed protein product [Oncorhynchus mykiss]
MPIHIARCIDSIEYPKGTMSLGSKSKGVQGYSPSSLLSPQENERLEDLLGRRCASLATAVVQLYMALPHSPTCWSLQHTGVACFTKDNPRRSYFIRLFDVKKGQLTWEQELYNQMIYHSPRPFFHAFAADDCQVGLNFVNEQESETFLCAVEDKINQRNRQGQVICCRIQDRNIVFCVICLWLLFVIFDIIHTTVQSLGSLRNVLVFE